VLEQADLVLCHGGSGTVYGALAAGIPVVVVPVFADQFENGRRVAATGAGLVVEPEPAVVPGPRTVIADADAPRITAAAKIVVQDPSYRRAAEVIAAEMAATPTVDDVLTTILER
jgi:UDP:flavonoid glycosyltransferase YjiC (YdhE family)